MKKSILILIAVTVTALTTYGKSEVKLRLNHLLGAESFALNQKTQNDLGNDFNLKRMEYYISELSVTHDGGKETKAKDVYILVNAAQNNEYSLGEMDVTTIEGITFSIGVDPGVNNADLRQWPASHPLAPKNPSMHWGWAAGYRFVAMEGKSGSSLNQVFEIHALGNENYFKINIPTGAKEDNGAQVIELNADYTMAIKGLDVSSGLVKHGTDGQAVKLLRNFQNHVFKSLDGKGNTLNVAKQPVLNVSTYPNPSQGNVHMELSAAGNYTVYVRNTVGALVQNVHVENNKSADFVIDNPGMYLIEVRRDAQLVAASRVLIQ